MLHMASTFHMHFTHLSHTFHTFASGSVIQSSFLVLIVYNYSMVDFLHISHVFAYCSDVGNCRALQFLDM